MLYLGRKERGFEEVKGPKGGLSAKHTHPSWLFISRNNLWNLYGLQWL